MAIGPQLGSTVRIRLRLFPAHMSAMVHNSRSTPRTRPCQQAQPPLARGDRQTTSVQPGPDVLTPHCSIVSFSIRNVSGASGRLMSLHVSIGVSQHAASAHPTLATVKGPTQVRIRLMSSAFAQPLPFRKSPQHLRRPLPTTRTVRSGALLMLQGVHNTHAPIHPSRATV
jgi:hypothetical protein